jgi:Type I phosphodiesterase / nucleotide pyrophosphatase/Chitobiase/beta-hexosaminidase C-terminal domain/PA14 domain
MSRKVFGCLAFVICVVTGLYGCGSVEKTSDPALSTKHVIVIGVDAMSPNGIVNADTPVMDHMMKNGAYTLNARGVLPTSSSTNWASMVSGAGPEQHGVTSNSWERDDHNIPPVSTGAEDIFPTIFGVVREKKPDLEIGAIYNWSGFGRLIERSVLSFDRTEKDQDTTVQVAIDYIKNKKPGFLFIHLDHVDHVGHSEGHKTPEFYQAVTEVDQLIGDIIQGTKDAGIYDDTVFIVSADHGGIGYGHGGQSLDELEIPFLMYGNQIKKNHLIKHRVYTYDNAATVAFLLGVEQPYAWIGKPVKSAIEGFREPSSGNQAVQIAAPTIYPAPYLFEPAGGLFVDKDAEVKIKATSEGAQIRYTLDGTEPNRNSELYTGPFNLKQSAVVKAKTFLSDTQESSAAIAYFRLVNSSTGNGVSYQYYEGDKWKFLPVFATLSAKASGQKYQFRIGDINQRSGQYAIRFASSLKIDTAGKYKFYIASDDGSKLYINNKLLVDNDGGHGVIERAKTVELTAGKHDITVEYFNAAGGAWLDVFYKGPGVSKQIIPAEKLFLK